MCVLILCTDLYTKSKPYTRDSDICSVYEPYTWTRHYRYNTWLSHTKALNSGKTK